MIASDKMSKSGNVKERPKEKTLCYNELFVRIDI